jgi:hypothetical protein
MKDNIGGWTNEEYERYLLRRQLGIFVLMGSLLCGAKYYDYLNSFKDDDINEVYILEDEEEIKFIEEVSYKEDNLRYNVSLDPYLISEDSTSFTKRVIRNDGEVKKLKRKKR